MERHFCASVFVIEPRSKRILLVKHIDYDTWVQPGGHIDENETPEEAAVREVYEETGVKVKLLGERFPREDDFIRPLGIQRNRQSNGVHIDIIYMGEPINYGTLNMDESESTDIGWFTREELDEINVFEDIKITMDYILRNYFKEVMN